MATKLTEAQVREIRSKYATGYYRMWELAGIYGVDISTISLIWNRKRWGNVADA